MKSIFLLAAVASVSLAGTILKAVDPPRNRPAAAIAPDPDNGGLKLANGFGALVFADTLGRARHIIVDNAGTVFVKLDRLKNGKGIVELMDSNGDGRADQRVLFGTNTGTGVDVYKDYLYASSDTSLYRYKLTNGKVMVYDMKIYICFGILHDLFCMK